MSKKELRIHNTSLDHLIANLRGEIGEIVTTWVLWRWLRSQEVSLQTPDVAKDLANRELAILTILTQKLRDELVARLSELGEENAGRLTFHFATAKLKRFEAEARAFSQFVQTHRFREKRNYDISHKRLPNGWGDHKHIWIPYPAILRAIARAHRLMKAIDRVVLGPSAPYLWREMRKKRYRPMIPSLYMVLPYIRLSSDDRVRVVNEEAAEGRQVWSEVETIVDGRKAKVLAAKEWGIIALGHRVVVLPEYPLQSLTEISTASPAGDDAHSSDAPL